MITSRLFQSSLSVRSACQVSLCLGKSYLQLQHSFSVIIMIFLITIIIVIISIVIMDIVFIIIIITKNSILMKHFYPGWPAPEVPCECSCQCQVFSWTAQNCFSSSNFSFLFFYFLTQLELFLISIFSHSSKWLLISPPPPLMNSLNTNDMRN